MAIINTFPKCLDSPYLLIDKDAPARVGALMSTAADRLEAAANINHTGVGDMADVSFLSYEAMFNCLRALVYAKGYREMGLRCLMLACEDLYVKTGLLEVGHIHAFERAQGLKRPPAENLAAAASFVKRTIEILRG
jgi:uncharacterized protein (UPF0332 family)